MIAKSFRKVDFLCWSAIKISNFKKDFLFGLELNIYLFWLFLKSAWVEIIQNKKILSWRSFVVINPCPASTSPHRCTIFESSKYFGQSNHQTVWGVALGSRKLFRSRGVQSHFYRCCCIIFSSRVECNCQTIRMMGNCAATTTDVTTNITYILITLQYSKILYNSINLLLFGLGLRLGLALELGIGLGLGLKLKLGFGI